MKKVCCISITLFLLLAAVGALLLISDRSDSGEFPQEMCAEDGPCRIRAGAGVEFEAVGWLERGEHVTVTDLVEGTDGRSWWYRVDRRSLPENAGITAGKYYIRGDLLEPVQYE